MLLKFLILSNKEDDALKRIEKIFLKNLLNSVIKNKALEIVRLQEMTRSDEQDFKSSPEKIYKFSKYKLLIVFLDIYIYIYTYIYENKDVSTYKRAAI